MKISFVVVIILFLLLLASNTRTLSYTSPMLKLNYNTPAADAAAPSPMCGGCYHKYCRR